MNTKNVPIKLITVGNNPSLKPFNKLRLASYIVLKSSAISTLNINILINLIIKDNKNINKV